MSTVVTAPSSASAGAEADRLRLPLSVARLVAALGGEPVGKGADEVVVRSLRELDRAGPGDLTFYDNPAYRQELDGTRAAVVALPRRLADHTALPRIAVGGSARSYLGMLAEKIVAGGRQFRGIHPRASVDPGASVDASSSVAAGAVVGADAVVGRDAQLRANAVLGAGCRLGAGSIVHEGAVVGSDGFGFFTEDGRARRFPHLGAVSVGADVEIGANSCIDRGVLGDTEIGDRVKIDNLVQIGHNVRIGDDCVICGAVAIAGSARLAEGCVIGGAACINGHVRLSRGTKVMGASVVKASVRKPSGTVGGFIPAVDQEKFARLWRALLKLSSARRRNGC